MNYHATIRILAVASMAWLTTGSVGLAQQPVRVRGTIEKIDGQVLEVKSRDGADLTVKLADNLTVNAVVKASFDDIKQGSFIGVTALPETDGSWHAVEVHIFPEAMRGTGEGNRPWDLQPKSTMTNAAVAQTVSRVDGHDLTLKYQGGEKTVTVVPQTTIVAFTPGDKSELKPGAKVFIPAAEKKEDGTLQAARIIVGRDAAPPM